MSFSPLPGTAGEQRAPHSHLAWPATQCARWANLSLSPSPLRRHRRAALPRNTMLPPSGAPYWCWCSWSGVRRAGVQAVNLSVPSEAARAAPRLAHRDVGRVTEVCTRAVLRSRRGTAALPAWGEPWTCPALERMAPPRGRIGPACVICLLNGGAAAPLFSLRHVADMMDPPDCQRPATRQHNNRAQQYLFPFVSHLASNWISVICTLLAAYRCFNHNVEAQVYNFPARCLWERGAARCAGGRPPRWRPRRPPRRAPRARCGRRTRARDRLHSARGPQGPPLDAV